MKRPTARASRVKKAASEKTGVEENASQDEGVRTQHYSPTGKDNHQHEVEQIDEQEEHETLNQKPKAKSKGKAKARANNKINKASQSPPKNDAGKSKSKAQGKDKEKGEEKRKRIDDAKTPPSKHTRTSPKSTGSGKKTFARRWQPIKDPSKTFWAALKDAFEQKVQRKVQAPSSLEDQSCSKTPWCSHVFQVT